MNDDPLLQRYRAETTPDDAAVDRVARRISAAEAPKQGRLALGLAGLTFLAATAALIFAVGARTRSPPPLTPEAPLVRELASTESTRTFEAGDDILIGVRGSARQDGHTFTLDAGTLDVEVPPDRGLDVAVLTREARVDVVGTGFVVERGARGTHVRVRHGVVRVTCASDEPKLLEAGEATSCGPVSAAGMLALARERRAAGAGVSRLLVDIDAGLARSTPDDPVTHELRLLRAELCFNAGRLDEARASLAGLGETPARADDVHRLRLAIEASTGHCDAARAELAQLRAPSAEDAQRLEACGR